jgi:AcrR family transcriptional regulator
MKTRKVLRVPFQAAIESDRTRARILEAARSQFLQFGFSQTTMAEIASTLGISKATLYKYFSGKEVLLREIIFGLFGEMEAGIDALIKDEKTDFAQKLRGILSLIGLKLAGMGGLVTLDIQRTAPELWKEVDEFRKVKILSKIKWIIQEGVETGVFRADFDQDLLVLMYISLIQSIMNPATLVQFSLSFAEGFEMIIKIVLEGILTDKGRTGYFPRILPPHKRTSKES